MNDLKLKMAVDARRKWLPREKVMPGKPGGDDGDAHTADQSERSPFPVQWAGTALPPMGVIWVWQRLGALDMSRWDYRLVPGFWFFDLFDHCQ